MHDTAHLTGRAFFQCYTRPPAPSILDVGSMDVNGSLRAVAPTSSRYTGIDLAAGPGVDVVVEAGKAFPFLDNSFDQIVSTSCFEHDPMFWLTFIEMARVVKPGGFIYISAPSNGPYHGHPGDCWRFYADAASALAMWANIAAEVLAKPNIENYPIELIESFMMEPHQDIWTDNVMVFAKTPFTSPRSTITEYLRARS